MKKSMITVFLTMIGILLWAVDANDFLIGAYTQYQIRYAGSDYEANFQSLGTYMKNAGYNAAVYGSAYGYSQSIDNSSYIPAILEKMADSDVKSLFFDNAWFTSPGTGKVGVTALSFGNYLKIESEYKLNNYPSGSFTVDEEDSLGISQSTCIEQFNYVTDHNCGKRVYGNLNYSNRSAWVCDQSAGHLAGIALTNPRKRWKPGSRLWPELLSKDIVFFTPAINDNKLYLTVAIKFDNVPADSEVATISLKLYNPANLSVFTDDDQGYFDTTDATRYVNIPLTPCFTTADGALIKNVTYSDVLIDNVNNSLFEFYVDLSTLTPYMTGSSALATRSFYHICPEVYWHGNGKLTIDYITIEDHFNRSVRLDPNSNYFSYLENQLNELASIDTNNNLLYHMSMDEPFAGQLQMYKHIQNYLNSFFPAKKMITSTWLRDSGLNVDDHNTPYNFHKLFLKEISPDRIMVDIYPVEGDIVWNGVSQNVQNRIDSMIGKYHNLVTMVQSSNSPDTEIFYVPQTFGEVKYPSGPWTYNMPPRSMIKALKFLPLCFAADGMVDFCLAVNPAERIENGYWVTPLSHQGLGTDKYNNLMITPYVSSYGYITDANSKIAKYGPIIKGLTWENANKIMTSGVTTLPVLQQADMINLGSMLLDNLNVDAIVDNTGYTGHVQCGYYTSSAGIPYFMLVNRRAVYERTGSAAPPAGTSIKQVDLFFEDAASQLVRFTPNTVSHNVFGTHIAMYDPYDSTAVVENSGVIEVEIGPGDGKLLQMCSSLPPNVTSNADVKSIAYLSGNITIDNSAEVTIHPGTTTNIIANSTIRVKGGSTLNISGTVDIFENVSIIVEEGSSISFNNAICKWGASSILHVENSELSATNTTLENFTNGVRWGGLRVSDSSQVILNNSHFTNAQFNSIQNSDCLITDCNFSIPSTSCGLLVANTEPGHQTDIINTLPGRGFHGSSNIANQGISFGTMRNDVNLSNIEFQNLWHGITKSAQPYASDTIVDCEFSNCQVGIWLFNNSYSSQIENCNFSSQSGTYGTGISLEASSPKITNCNFDNLQRGIISQYAIHSGLGMQSVISESTFQNCELGIESRSSNHHLVGNYFYYNNRAIVNHAGSNLNLSYYANNVLKSWNTNIQFFDTMPYESTIQLFKGHNDLYHLIGSYDFSFDENYYSMPLTLNHQINASKNWFETGQYSVNNPSYLDYVFVDLYDSSPSMPAPPDLTDRLCKALSYEDNQMYELAGALYKIIIDEKLEEEKSYITCAIDGLYRCTQLIADPAWELAEYFDQKAIQCAIDDPHLSALLKDYLAKVFVIEKDFQAAIDLIQLRIDNPISEIDSLRAVLDLEIVLQIASMQEAKSPINTKYSQYQYPDSIVYKEMHDKNWEKYIKAMNHDDPENVIVIPPQPQIQSNYPNPFNPSTTVAFSVPEYGSVKLSIYNLRGQKVKDLINTDMQKGFHKAVWDGTDAKHNCVSSGLYLLRLETAKGISSRKVMLLK